LSRASDAGNAVVYAAEQVCALYGVQVTREQSRQFNVQGTAGRWRPMFFGTWTDTSGRLTHFTGKRKTPTNIWNAGKADLLARPRVRIQHSGCDGDFTMHSVPLWIECKSGAGTISEAQVAFKSWVESNGDAYLLLHDDVRPLMDWFDAHGVEKHCDDAALKLVTDPIDAGELYALPCKWCQKLRSEHIGPAFGCAGTSGRVWSPDLKAAVAGEQQ
jgi:hypothetical protein